MSDEPEDLIEQDETSNKGVRLTLSDWEQIRSLWELGTATLVQLAEQFGIRSDTIHRRLSKMGAVKGSRAHEISNAIGNGVNDEAALQAMEATKRINETKDDHYRWAEAIGKMTMQELIDAKKAGRVIATADANLGALHKAAKTLETIRLEPIILLGLDKEDGDPDEMPELLISELTPEMIETMQASMRGLEIDDLDGLDVLTNSSEDTIEEDE